MHNEDGITSVDNRLYGADDCTLGRHFRFVTREVKYNLGDLGLFPSDVWFCNELGDETQYDCTRGMLIRITEAETPMPADTATIDNRDSIIDEIDRNFYMYAAKVALDATKQRLQKCLDRSAKQIPTGATPVRGVLNISVIGVRLVPSSQTRHALLIPSLLKPAELPE